ncbi:unnamed protein product [Calypogeia fissa]
MSNYVRLWLSCVRCGDRILLASDLASPNLRWGLQKRICFKVQQHAVKCSSPRETDPRTKGQYHCSCLPTTSEGCGKFSDWMKPF